MEFLSTRGGESVTAAQAIVRGICPSGGLYVPASFPQLDVESVLDKSYQDIASDVMSRYLDVEANELNRMIATAYAGFDDPDVTPLHRLNNSESILELWHGPTMAFKDVALQMLPYLMRDSILRTGEDRQIYILVATSGDTGKAALAGFCDVPGTRVLVFYPYGGVSRAQRLQMVTQEGSNVDVCAVHGNFDDAQTGVKKIFASNEAKNTVRDLGFRLSSANSINFGRLLPQIVYYFASYAALRRSGRILAGESINFCVPTGNFGDILAGYYAMRMGLPVHKLICASNQNHVLTDFFEGGVYNDQRPFYRSMSCSIDILISSNLERLLFEISGRKPESVKTWMRSLSADGRYAVSDAQRSELSKVFCAGWCDETDTLSTIRRIHDCSGYLMDPHTAVAQTVYERYRKSTGDETQTVLLSTANPYKFATDVLSVFETPSGDDFVNADRLFALSGIRIPTGLSDLLNKPERHLDVCDLDDMLSRVISPLR